MQTRQFRIVSSIKAFDERTSRASLIVAEPVGLGLPARPLFLTIRARAVARIVLNGAFFFSAFSGVALPLLQAGFFVAEAVSGKLSFCNDA